MKQALYLLEADDKRWFDGVNDIQRLPAIIQTLSDAELRNTGWHSSAIRRLRIAVMELERGNLDADVLFAIYQTELQLQPSAEDILAVYHS